MGTNSSTLTLNIKNKVSIFGTNAGMLGDGTAIGRPCPTEAVGVNGIREIAVGQAHALYLHDDGTVWASGYNSFSQLGDGTTTDRVTAVQVPGLTGIVHVAAYGDNSFAVRGDGTLWAWGANSNGQLGTGDTVTQRTPVKVAGLTDVVKVASGAGHTLVLKKDGTVWGYGAYEFGQLGIAPLVVGYHRWTPVQVAGLTNVTDIAVGYAHSLAVTADGKAWGWGSNGQTELGCANETCGPCSRNGSTLNNTPTPIEIEGITDAAKVYAYDEYSVVLHADGTVTAFGDNAYGQLGAGVTGKAVCRNDIPGVSGVVDVAAAPYHVAVAKADGTVQAWGSNSSGQLGNNTSTDALTPVTVVASTCSGQLNLIPSIAAAPGQQYDLANTAAGEQSFLAVTIPEGTRYASFRVEGSGGDADIMATKASSLLGEDIWSLKSISPSADDVITVQDPEPGVYYLKSFTHSNLNYAKFKTETRTSLPVQEATQIAKGTHVALNSGEYQSVVYYKVHLPAKAGKLVVTTSGNDGDCDLYLAKDTFPSFSSYYRSENTGCNETITATDAEAGDWYIGVVGAKRYYNVTLNVTAQSSGTAASLPLLLPSEPPKVASNRFSATATPPVPMLPASNAVVPAAASKNQTATDQYVADKMKGILEDAIIFGAGTFNENLANYVAGVKNLNDAVTFVDDTAQAISGKDYLTASLLVLSKFNEYAGVPALGPLLDGYVYVSKKMVSNINQIAQHIGASMLSYFPFYYGKTHYFYFYKKNWLGKHMTPTSTIQSNLQSVSIIVTSSDGSIYQQEDVTAYFKIKGDHFGISCDDMINNFNLGPDQLGNTYNVFYVLAWNSGKKMIVPLQGSIVKVEAYNDVHIDFLVDDDAPDGDISKYMRVNKD